MQALLLVDVQNEFAPTGLRPVPNYESALEVIRRHVAEARRAGRPIAWVRHHNKPHESRAFVPGTWGAAFASGLGPSRGHGPERLFEKDVYGAFSAVGLEEWLRGLGVTEVLIAGFFAHMCLSTSGREALVRGFDVVLDPEATGARDVREERLGVQSADEVRRTALLHLVNMGARLLAESPIPVAAQDSFHVTAREATTSGSLPRM